ncbi:hypothetical protein ATG_03580 [Desulfurococcaceae archaeon AG1]|jgi:2-dehydropantoate 2-reductase|nr:MAG: hypothetical protein DJ555_03010 [Desulfurococcaceae archaeon]GAY25155.1 hypothetical protein ATG_03580 [Desulfurococcaceae archaeon AG1]
MRISIVGAGSVGSLLTHILNKANIEPVLVKRSPNTPTPTRILTPDGSEAKLRYKSTVYSYDDWLYSDVIFIATKAYDASSIIERISTSRDISLTILVQNGLGVFEEGVRRLGPGRIAQLVLNHGVSLADHDTCVWVGGSRSYLGMVKGYRNPYLDRIADLLRDLDVVVVEDIEPYRWLKLVVNAVINPITALLEVRNKAIADSELLRTLATMVCEEVRRIAGVKGIEFPRDPCREVFEVAIKTGDNISSMLSDLARCRKTEIDFINGYIVRIAEDLGIEATVNRILYIMVKAKESLKHCRNRS